MKDITQLVAAKSKGQQLQEAAAEAAYLRAAVLWHKTHARRDGLTAGDAKKVKKQKKTERNRQGKAQQETAWAKRVTSWLDKCRSQKEVQSKARHRAKQRRQEDFKVRHQKRQAAMRKKGNKADERGRVAAAAAKSREDSVMWAPVGVGQRWKMTGGPQHSTGRRFAHKKWDKVKVARQPTGRRARYKFQGGQRCTTEAAMWMAVVTMAMTSGTGATSWASLAAGMAAGAGTWVPVAPVAMVAAGVELKRRQRGKEMARIWHALDPGEQARAWKKERQKQKEDDRQSQSQMDKKWEHESESMYASREYATQGMQGQLYSRKQFSGAEVKLYIKTDGKHVEESTVADTGAATEIMAECRLDAETMSTMSCNINRARNLRNASGGSMGSRGEAMVAFTLGDCPLEFHHPFQAMMSHVTPTILGCELWDKYQASFCFTTRKISLIVEGQEHTISFTCGTESKMCMVDEPLMAVEYVWVQEGEPATAKTAPGKETAQVGWSCGDVWLVEERVSALEVNPMETAADTGHVQQPGPSDEHHDCPGWTDDGRNVMEQEGSDEVEVLEALERARWRGEIRRASHTRQGVWTQGQWGVW